MIIINHNLMPEIGSQPPQFISLPSLHLFVQVHEDLVDVARPWRQILLSDWSAPGCPWLSCMRKHEKTNRKSRLTKVYEQAYQLCLGGENIYKSILESATEL